MERHIHADSLHPTAGRGMLVPWLGNGQQRLLKLLANEAVTCTASPLHFMAHNAELALFAAAPTRMGLVLDPLTLWRQLPRSHRGAAYRREPGGDAAIFDPDTDTLAASELAELAEDPLDAQRARGGTLLLTSYHLSGGPTSRSRRLDLDLARLGAEHFLAERMDQPALNAAVSVPRELYATLAVERDIVTRPSAVTGLVDAYAALDVDGYYVRIEGFHDRGDAGTLRGGGALLGALTETGRPVLCVGAGTLHVALLVADISSCIGLGEAERFSMPDVSRPRPSGPRLRAVYHSSFHRSFQGHGQPRGAPSRRHRVGAAATPSTSRPSAASSTSMSPWSASARRARPRRARRRSGASGCGRPRISPRTSHTTPTSRSPRTQPCRPS